MELTSNLIDKEEIKQLIKGVIDKVETAFAISIARLFICRSSSNKFEDTGLYGALLFVKNRSFDNYYFQLYSFNSDNANENNQLFSYDPCFICEIPYDAKILSVNDNFFTLALKDVIIGFNFASSKESSMSDRNSHPPSPSTSDSKRFVNKVEQLLKDYTEKSSSAPIAADSVPERGRSKSITQRIFGIFKPSTQAPVAAEIGPVVSVKHVAHVGVDMQFELKEDGELPQDPIMREFYIKIMKDAGIKKKDLKNPEIRQAVNETMKERMPDKSVVAKEVMNFSRQSTRGPAPALPSTSSLRDQKLKQYVKAKYEFKPQEEGVGQMPMKVGDVFRVIKHHDDGWIKAEFTPPDGTKIKGLIPENHCVPCDEAGNIIKKKAIQNNEDHAPSAPAASQSIEDNNANINNNNHKSISSESNIASSQQPKKPPPARPRTNILQEGNQSAATSSSKQNVDHQDDSTLNQKDVANDNNEEVAKPARPNPFGGAGKADFLSGIKGFDKSNLKKSENEDGNEEEREETKKPSANPMLAGIQNFNLNSLKKSNVEEEEEGTEKKPPMNPMLAGIQGFDPSKLKKVEETKKSSVNPMLAGIQGFDPTKLKKVEERKIPEVEAPAASTGTEASSSIASALRAKLANVRMNIKQDSDDEDSGGDDWD